MGMQRRNQIKREAEQTGPDNNRLAFKKDPDGYERTIAQIRKSLQYTPSVNSTWDYTSAPLHSRNGLCTLWNSRIPS